MHVVWTAEAEAQLTRIDEYIGRHDSAAARRMVDLILARAQALEHHPGRGRKLREIPNSGLRELIIGNYRLIYRIRRDRVEVLTVFEGHRRLREDELGSP